MGPQVGSSMQAWKRSALEASASRSCRASEAVGGAMASSSVGGLSGAFIPVSEDHDMIAAVEAGALSLDLDALFIRADEIRIERQG